MMETLPSGTVLHERYRIERVLGGGGFGHVYLAVDLGTNQFYALKEYLVTGASGQEQLKHEAAVLSQLHHPNLPAFFSKQMIQHLVTSNPSPAYIQRVASVFLNGGNDAKGDLRAVITAILTDPEARAGDDPAARKTIMSLVEDTGFDAIDAGPLVESWRQQPGTRAFCTDLTAEDLRSALAAADRSRAPHVREEVLRRVSKLGGEVTNEDVVRLNRSIAA